MGVLAGPWLGWDGISERPGCSSQRILTVDLVLTGRGILTIGLPPQGFKGYRAQIAGQVLLEALFDQADGHAHTGLDGELVAQPHPAGVRQHGPGALEATEIAGEHLEVKNPFLPAFLQLQTHGGCETQPDEALAAHLLEHDHITAPLHQTRSLKVGDEVGQPLVIREHLPDGFEAQGERQLGGEPTGGTGQTLDDLLNGLGGQRQW